jgi:hypothetical protein
VRNWNELGLQHCVATGDPKHGEPIHGKRADGGAKHGIDAHGTSVGPPIKPWPACRSGVSCLRMGLPRMHAVAHNRHNAAARARFRAAATASAPRDSDCGARDGFGTWHCWMRFEQRRSRPGYCFGSGNTVRDVHDYGNGLDDGRKQLHVADRISDADGAAVIKLAVCA